MRPLITVVIPALNEAMTLPACLESLDNQQDAPAYEIVVVNNNSSDNTATIARKYGARVVDEPRAGVCFARAAGTNVALGQIIVSTDADCTFPLDWLSSIAQAFQNQPDVNLLIGNYRFRNGPFWANPLLEAYEWLCLQLHFAYGWTGYVSAANLAFRRDVFQGYDTSLTQGGDELFVLSQLKLSGRVLYRFTNPISTSSRRLQQGFVKTFGRDFLYSYLLNYVRSCRTGRNKAGTYAAHRYVGGSENSNTGIPLAARLVILLVTMTLFSLIFCLGRIVFSHIHHPIAFGVGYTALSMGLLAYATLSPHSQLAGPQAFKVRTKRRVVALTFDDGPNSNFSLAIAKCVASYGGKASFFQVGCNVVRQPEISEALSRQGHLIGNHSFNHRFTDYFRTGWRSNVAATSDAITAACGVRPRYIRLPWLFRTPWLLRPLYEMGLQPVAGSFIDLREIKQPDGVQMARRAAHRVKPGAILIMHDGYNATGADRRQTVIAVAELCRLLHADGYEFVRLDQLL